MAAFAIGLVAIASALLPAAASAATTIAVGDSITNQTRADFLWDWASAGFSDTAVDAHNGYRIDQMRPYLQLEAAANPGLARVFLFGGTNDGWQFQNLYNGNPGTGIAPNPDAAMQRLHSSIGYLHAAVHDVIDRRPKACVFLVTVHDVNLYNTGPFHYAVTVLNAEMKKVADAFGQVYLVDWASKSQGKPWFSDYIGHLTSEGQRQLAITYLNWTKASRTSCPQ